MYVEPANNLSCIHTIEIEYISLKNYSKILQLLQNTHFLCFYFNKKKEKSGLLVSRNAI